MKNWTLRQRILASFAVIIAIMLLMVVVSYSRLLKIESSEASVREDALPGLYYSSMVRSAWSESYLGMLGMLGLEQGQGINAEDVSEFKGYATRLQEQMELYRETVTTDQDEVEYAAFEKLHEDYHRTLSAVIELYKRNQGAEAIKMFNEELTPTWTAGRTKLTDILRHNKGVADRDVAAIDDAVVTAKIVMGISLLIAVLAAALCGLLLMRAIMAPMNRIVSILETMRTGDLSGRLNLERKDEFGAVETGFNDMMTELTSLVSQAQRSSVQVTTSVTEIAATSKQQQATATETAATTTEIGATSRAVSYTHLTLPTNREV